MLNEYGRGFCGAATIAFYDTAVGLSILDLIISNASLFCELGTTEALPERKKRLQQPARTLKQKLAIIEEVESGTRQSEICRKYDLSKSTLSSWLSQREKLRLEWEKDRNLNRKRVRTTKNDVLDQALLSWYQQQKSERLPIDGPLLLSKANTLCEMMNFPATCRSWIDRWKVRHQVGTPRTRGATSSTDLDNAESEGFSAIMSTI